MNALLAHPVTVDACSTRAIPGCADIALIRAALVALGVHRSLAEIVRVAQQFPAEQLSLLALHEMLGQLGVASEGRSMPASAMASITMPTIALLETAAGPRFCLVEPAQSGYPVFDGGTGWSVVTASELARQWRGAALSLAAMPMNRASVGCISPQADFNLRAEMAQHLRVVEGAFDGALCGDVVRAATQDFAPSRVGGERDAGWHSMHRSSSSAMVGLANPQLQHELSTRAAALIPGLTADCFELAQCVRYDVSQQYRPHLDVPARSPLAPSRQRTWTVLVYLNDDFEGGETVFPLLRQSVQPRRGAALVFRNRDSRGVANMYALHAGQPVRRGIKFACNLWASAPE